MNIHREPNLVIFRIPDEGEKESEWDNGFRLVEMPFLGGKLHETGTIFLPHKDDESYRSLELSHIVLARKTAEGANELARFTIRPESRRDVEAVYLMGQKDMEKTVKELTAVYMADEQLFDSMLKLCESQELHAALLKDFTGPYSLGVGQNNVGDHAFILQLTADQPFWLPDGKQTFTHMGVEYLLVVTRDFTPPVPL